VLSERETRVLAAIAHEFQATEPQLAQRLATMQPRRPLAVASVIVGAAALITGCAVLLLPAILAGFLVLIFGLFRLPVANTQSSLRGCGVRKCGGRCSSDRFTDDSSTPHDF
jgi:hypothetical protein